jgi:hypothetical protein
LWFIFLANQISNSPLPIPPYHDNTHGNYRQQPGRRASANSQQQQNEQHLHLLSLGKSFFIYEDKHDEYYSCSSYFIV